MGIKRKKKVGARPQKVNIRKEGTSASRGLEVGCAAKDADARSLTAASPARQLRERGRAAGGIDIRVGYATAAAAGISGDAAVSCGLPGGSRALILSDGMGKGIKAAAGSRLVVTRLRRNLKAGMPVAKAIKEVNRYMIEQSEAGSHKCAGGTAFAAIKDGTDFAATRSGTGYANGQIGNVVEQVNPALGQSGTVFAATRSGTAFANGQIGKVIEQVNPASGQVNPAAGQVSSMAGQGGTDYEDEDFATVDLTVIDRQSCRARFYKMGAATSFIMRQGHVRKIKGAALPVGIIPRLRLTHISAVLKEGDLIVMVSDGITDADRKDPEACWLCEYLSRNIYREDFDAGRLSARQIAADILAEAEARYGGRERDDLTVAAALIVKAAQTVQRDEE